MYHGPRLQDGRFWSADQVIDLFAGPGGWDVAARRLGFEPLGIEWDKAACETRRAAPMPTLQADVASLDPNDFAPVEGLIASPPCPTFSAAGNGAGKHDKPHIIACAHELAAGFDSRYQYTHLVKDERSLLTLEPLRWALALRPRWLAFEQVPAVLELWSLFGALLAEAAGYHIATGILNAEQYGVPQTRKRAILVGSLDGPVSLPEPTHSRYYSRDPKRLDAGVSPWVSMAEALGWGMTARPSYTVTGGGTDTGGAEPLGNGSRKGMTRERDSGRWALRMSTQPNSAVRLVGEGSPTLAFGHDSASCVWTDGTERVRITSEEAAILQSFPREFPWQGTKTKRFQQVGNAIPCGLAEHVLRAARCP